MHQRLGGHHELADGVHQLGDADADHHEQVALLPRLVAQGIEHGGGKQGTQRRGPPGPAAEGQVEGEGDDGQGGPLVDPDHVRGGEAVANEGLHQAAGEAHGRSRHQHGDDARQADLEDGHLAQPVALAKQGLDHPQHGEFAGAQGQRQQGEQHQGDQQP